MVAYKDEIFYDKEQKSSVRRSRQKNADKEFADTPKGMAEPTGELITPPSPHRAPRHLNPRDQKALDAIESEVEMNTAKLAEGMGGGKTTTPPQNTAPKNFEPKPGVNAPTRPAPQAQTTPVQRPAGAPQKDSGLQTTHNPNAQTQSSDPMKGSKEVEKK
jgi:hypothetical protein